MGFGLRASARGYELASLIVLVALAGMAGWVAAGHGFPGGSLWRRLTGQEGLTGGLTTAVREILRGDVRAGMARHVSALPIVVYLVAQCAWRLFVVVRRPSPARIWVADLVVSLALFAAAIYVPIIVR